MLDADLAALYGVPTKRFNEQVKRNFERFPPDFMLQLSEEEWSKELTAKLNELEHKVDSHDQAIAGLINAIRELMRQPEAKHKRSIGFVTGEGKLKNGG